MTHVFLNKLDIYIKRKKKKEEKKRKKKKKKKKNNKSKEVFIMTTSLFWAYQGAHISSSVIRIRLRSLAAHFNQSDRNYEYSRISPA